MTWGRSDRRGAPANSCAPSWTPGATSSTRRTATPTAPPRRSSAELIDDEVQREDVVICTKSGISRRGRAARGRHVAAQPAGPARHVAGTARHRPRRPVAGPHLVRRGAARPRRCRPWSGRSAPGGRATSASRTSAGWQTARAMSLLEQARVPLVANEIEYSLANRIAEPDLRRRCQALGFGPAALVAAGARGADGQVPQRDPGGLPGGVAATSRASPPATSTTAAPASSRRWPSPPRAWRSAPPRWPWPGCATGPAWSPGRGRAHHRSAAHVAGQRVARAARQQLVAALDEVSAT